MATVSLVVLILLVVSRFCDTSPSYTGKVERMKYWMSQRDHLELIRESMGLFENKTLTVCVVVREPFVIFNKVGLDSNQDLQQAMADFDNYSGIAVEVVKRLSRIFKFKVRVIRPKDGQFGVLSQDKGWTGLMGELVQGSADIGLTALSITVNRAEVIDFTRAYYVETAAILLRTPGEVQNYLAIFEPFSGAVWILLLATIVVLILLITIMTKLEENQRQQSRLHKLARFLVRHEHLRRNSSSNESQYSRKLEQKVKAVRESQEHQEFGSTWHERFYYAASCVLNILLIRDIRHPPSQTPIRILVCVWWLSTIVIVNIYFGILFGQLVVPRRPKSVESLDELVRQDEIQWCVTGGSAIYELFRRSPNTTIYGQLGQSAQLVYSADEGVQRVLNSNWAFIREQSILTFKMAQEHIRLRQCKLQLARERFFSVGFGLGLGKNSSYLRAFDSALTLMIENGVVAYWEARYWPTRNQYTECQLEPLREGEPLSIKHFISIYLVDGLIILMALILLAGQTLVARLALCLATQEEIEPLGPTG